MLRQFPFLSRFYSKLVYELLPGAVISALGGVLLNQYYIKPAAPVAVTVTPASSDVVAAIHVEQTRLIDYLAKTSEPKAGPIAEVGPRQQAAAPHAIRLEIKTARADKSEKRIALKPPHAAPVIGPPLQLAQRTSAPPAIQPVAQLMPAPIPAVAAPAAPIEDTGIMARLHNVTAAVQNIPARIRSAVTFDDMPPRPPAPIGQEFFKASM